jgi:hypothetical protein
MRFDVDKPPRSRNRRVMRWRLVQFESEKAAHAQRIGRAPRDRALRVEPFEVAEQQHTEIPARWQARTADLVGVEALAQRLDISIEIGLVEDLIQSRVERMRGAARQVLCGYPHRRLFARRRRLPIAMADNVVRGIDRVDP